MKIRFHNTFHQTETELTYSTSNLHVIELSGKRLRRIFSELCDIDGCDCFRNTTIFIDEKAVQIDRFDLSADEEAIALILRLPGRVPETL
jgi:hypothetical protein